MTEIAVDTCISDVLYERNRVVLPGLGLLETKPKSANLDHISNTITPPSREISFNPNITVDDGMLVSFIKKKYNKEELTVRDAVADYIRILKTKMAQKEIVVIPDVGRMYIDFEKKIQFLPDRVNYDKDSFGLPTVKFKDTKPQPAHATTINAAHAQNVAAKQPVAPLTANQNNAPTPNSNIQNAMKEPVEDTVIPIAPTPVSEDNEFGDILRKIFPFLLILGLFAIGFIIYKAWSDNNNKSEVNDRIAEIEGRLNTKPEIEDDIRASYEDEDYEENDDFYEPSENEVEGYEEFDEDEYTSDEEEDDFMENKSATSLDGEAIVILGGFSEKKNVERLIRKIEKLGYDSYLDKTGPVNRVGVKFEYDTEKDIINMVKQLRREFDSSSWVLVPEGFEVKK